MNFNDLQNKMLAVVWPMAIVLGLAFVLISLSMSRGNQVNPVVNEADDVARVVSKLAVVPSEKPTITEVKNKADFQHEKYFDRLEVGDQILKYQQSGKLAVYRPSKKIVVFLMDYSVDDQRKPARIEIEIRNGSNYLGAAAELAARLKHNDMYSILDINQAKDKLYNRSQVVDLSGVKFSEEAAKIAELIKAEVATSTPDGEEPSKADILIIIGNN